MCYIVLHKMNCSALQYSSNITMISAIAVCGMLKWNYVF